MPAAFPNPRTSDDDSPIQGRTWWTAWIEELIGRVTPPCTRVVRLISETFEHPPTWRTRLTLRTHYLVCCYCRRYDKQLHRLRRFTVALPEHIEEVLPDQLSETVKERIKEHLRDSA